VRSVRDSLSQYCFVVQSCAVTGEPLDPPHRYVLIAFISLLINECLADLDCGQIGFHLLAKFAASISACNQIQHAHLCLGCRRGCSGCSSAHCRPQHGRHLLVVGRPWAATSSAATCTANSCMWSKQGAAGQEPESEAHGAATCCVNRKQQARLLKTRRQVDDDRATDQIWGLVHGCTWPLAAAP
jgi:hypothetical protein